MNQNGIDAITTLFLIMGLGFVLKKRHLMQKSSEDFIVILLQKAAIPGLMLYNASTQFTTQFLKDYYPAILASFLAILGAVLVGLVTARLFSISDRNQGVFTGMFAFSNTIFIGVPVITGIFGEKGIPYLMLYYLMNTLLFWTVGSWLVGGEQGSGLLSLSSLSKIFNPALLAFLLGLGLMMYHISLPAPAMRSLKYLSDLVTPLSTLYMGSIIADLSLKKFPGLKPTLLILTGRFLISPLLAYSILTLFGFSGLLVEVLVIASALPVMTQMSVLAGYYGKDKQYTAFMTALSTILCIFVLPFYLSFLQR
ncbi:AEC family transporter [Proteiniclasticum sp. QWL-01]|uniref:AEC family transporter n=1 Tax=Proteiniclasticum sp. QWL-01 TaxID=3036945 RepID=UPI00240F30FF|nr:AEC family transporter [Proteiniclasticum sp. QWL-01]WFF73035.1 AEC family transporter [Proteiniclasticum sp. QWL-01]